MLTIDLSTLSRSELRRLLDSARSRNQSGLEQRLLAELDARASGAPSPMAAPTPAARSPRPADRPRGRGMAVGLSVAASAVVVLGWGLSVSLPQVNWPTLPAAASTEAPAPVAAPRASVALVSLSDAPSPPLEATPQPVLQDVPPLTATPRKIAAANPCYGKPTPAERLVCGYPSLAIRDRDLKQAYDRALAAGADPVVLATAQAAWRARSARISEWQALAQSYDERIQEMESATVPAPAQVGNP